MNKYLFYTENNCLGGGNKYMSDLIYGLSQSKVDISIYCNHGGVFSFYDETMEVNYIKILSSYGKSNSNSMLARKIIYLFIIVYQQILLVINVFIFIGLLRKESPSKVVICNGGYPAALSCLSLVFASKIMKIPAVISIVSMPAQRRSFIRWYDRFFDYLICKSVESVIVNCFAIKKSLNDLRGFPNKKIKVIYNGIEDVRNPGSRILNNQNITIGCISRMDYNKGILILLEAFKKAQKKHPDIKLVLTGVGNAWEAIAEKVSNYSFSKSVQLMGFYEGDIDTVLKTIDIFVLPSFWEGLPYSVIEACRAGCAVIATDVGGVSEIIKNNENGILVAPQSVNDLYEAIIYLVNNMSAAQKFGINARKTYEEKFKRTDVFYHVCKEI